MPPLARAPRSLILPVFRTLAVGCVTLLLAVPLGILLLAFEASPRVADAGPPDAAAAAGARDLGASLQELIATKGEAGVLTVGEDELNGALASVRRLALGLAGRAQVLPDRVELDLSAGAPLLPPRLWLNLQLGFGASEQGLRVTSARVGHLPLPPALVVPALRLGLDRLLGDGLGGTALDGVAAVRIDGPKVTLVMDYPQDARWALFSRLKDRIHAFAGGTDAERIDVHLYYLDRAGRSGELPSRGTVLPYLRFAVARSAELAEDGDGRAELKAALLALTLYCGEPRFGPAIGTGLERRMRGRNNHCAGTTLDGRDDSRKHFIVSAGIDAARTGTTAFGMGELKELLDSNPGGEGFSFDDLAADLAGVRFADTFLAAPRASWPELLAQVTEEADILPAIDDLPSGMTDADFRSRYGDVDSPAYRAEVAEIQRRIDALPLYRTQPRG